ncbi:Abi family protein [Pseudarthrobacter sp. WHRI 8279]|uniref:Abi family protein n=1 Tax=Pseudarthrobacter sp. WHRI 8279 TaxID=3162566 RepID=UPI0032EA98FE
MEYTKEFKERDELLGQLEARGLAIPDPTAALNFLTRVGYFRSGAYRYVFRRLLPPEKIDARLHQYRSDDYIAGASIEHVLKLEAFDFKLARVRQEGLLDFEVRLRAAMAHTLAAKNVAATRTSNSSRRAVATSSAEINPLANVQSSMRGPRPGGTRLSPAPKTKTSLSTTY